MTDLSITQPERSGIPWPVFAVTVAAAFMVILAPADAT